MTYFNKERLRSYKAIIASAILISGIIIAAQSTLMRQAFAAKDEIEDTIDFSEDSLNIEDREVGPLEFTARWAPVESIDPKTIAIIFADCHEDEMPISSVQVFQSSQLRLVGSYPVGLPDDHVTWVFAVKNNDDRELWAGLGAVCAEDNPGGEADEDNVDDIDVRIKPINSILKDTIVIREESDEQDIDIDQHITNAITIKQTLNQIVNVVNQNGGNGSVVVNQIAQQAAGENIEQRADIKQFLLTVNPDSPQFADTTEALVAESQEPEDNEVNLEILNQATAEAEATAAQQQQQQNQTQAQPEATKPETEGEQQQPMQPGLNATDEGNATTAGEDDNATELQQQPMQPGLNATDEGNATTAGEDDNATELQQQPMQPGLNATDEGNATTAGEDETGRELSESLIENETQGASNFTEGGNFTIGGEGFENRTTILDDSNATTADDDDDDNQTTAETTDTATDTTTGNMTTGTQAGEGNQTQQDDDDGGGLLDSLTGPFEDLLGGGR
jgi:hypothetical protein